MQEEPDDTQEKLAFILKQSITTKKDKQPAVIRARLDALESLLKIKFSNCFESVRKAFLQLDSDYDGFITIEDVLKYFGNETDLNYNDLKKLIHEKDSTHTGRISYTDFSKWLGSAIHMPEGFMFRHDSCKNPQFD